MPHQSPSFPPDTLALKHTRPHIYNVVRTSIRSELAWLLEQKERDLEWPQTSHTVVTTANFLVLTLEQSQRLHANQEPLVPEPGMSIPVMEPAQ